MQKMRCMLLAVLMASSVQAFAQNEIRTLAPIGTGSQASKWLPAPPVTSGWVDSASPMVCTNWAPDPAQVLEGTPFEQTATDCKKTQQQTVQDREQNAVTHVYRNVGSPKLQYKVITLSSTRTAMGTQSEQGQWNSISPIVSDWENVGDVTGCTNWSPDPLTMANGVPFEQTASDCVQTQQHTVQSREQNSITHEYRNVGEPQIATQEIKVSQSRTAMGAESGTWYQADAYISTWEDTGEPTGCSPWTPDAATKALGYEFEQKSTGCQQLQQRIIQPREINDQTGAYRNFGDPITQNQFRDSVLTRKAIGTNPSQSMATMTTTVGRYATQVGLMRSVGLGEVLSNSNPAFELNYLTLGAAGKIYIGMVNPDDAQRITAITLEVLDASDNVIGVLSSGDVFPLEAPFVGAESTPELVETAGAWAAKFRVTLQFK